MPVGFGFDVHPFTFGRKLVLGGIVLDENRGLEGHSDADVLVHAVIDALLGAASLADIGTHFPDTDPAYKGVSSLELLERTREMLVEAGYTVENVDTTVVIDDPQIGPHRERMAAAIAGSLGIEARRVNVKATTTEGLGISRKGEGAAAYAVAVLRETR